MQRADLMQAIEYDDENVVMSVLYETPCCKEVRMAMQRHQVLRNHESAFPISLCILSGEVQLECEGENTVLRQGELLYLDSETKHHLEALEDSVIRLTLFTACRNDQGE